MDAKEALEKAETVCRREGFDKTAAVLRRLIPFVEAAEQACAAAFTLRIRENGAVTWEMGYEFIDKMEAAYRAMKERK